MRKVTFGFGAAVLMAGALMAWATPASAAISKTCWSHYDRTLDTYYPVWASGGGHNLHVNDTNLGQFSSTAACVTYFNSL